MTDREEYIVIDIVLLMTGGGDQKSGELDLVCVVDGD